MAHIIYVNTTCCNIRCHEQINVAFSELLENALALLLRYITRQ